MAYSDRDPLNSDELCGRSDIPLDLQAQRNGLSNSLQELVERARLCMAAGQLGNIGHVIAFLVPLHDDAELALSGFSHGDFMPEKGPVRKQPNAKLTDDEERAKDFRLGTCGRSRPSSFGPASGSVLCSSCLMPSRDKQRTQRYRNQAAWL